MQKERKFFKKERVGLQTFKILTVKKKTDHNTITIHERARISAIKQMPAGCHRVTGTMTAGI